MGKFYEKYPNFGLNGTFYVNGIGYFETNGTQKENIGYKINSLALPLGSMSKAYEENIRKGIYEDSEYEKIS